MPGTHGRREGGVGVEAEVAYGSQAAPRSSGRETGGLQGLGVRGDIVGHLHIGRLTRYVCLCVWYTCVHIFIYM